MNFLPKIEEILLLAIWKLKDDAYGTTIIEQVERDTGSKWVSGSVYSALHRLKKNRFVTTVSSEKNSDQIGRPRIYYSLTEAGRQKLTSSQKVTRMMWEGVPDFDKGI
ncbi:PadR family transcriptional regulator [candidate division KSB1 bacterium]